MLASQNGALKYGDVSRRTLRVIDIIASWTVNTFYNYLHEEAVTRHSQGRAGSITDGYRQMVKAYLDTFAHHDGYGKIVISLHKYYCDAEKQAMLALDEWICEIMGEFIPDDYKSIMTNTQRYDILRKILINAIEQFSSVVICTPMFDILISNHDEPSLVSSMKESMRGLLLAERHNMFARIHRASTNSEPAVNSAANMKAEIYRLAEENVLLKSKNDKLTAHVKKALDGMKARDRVINALNGDLQTAHRKMMQLQMQLSNGTPSGFSNVAAMLPPPKTPADDFKSSLDSVALNSGFPTLHPRTTRVDEVRPMSEISQREMRAERPIMPQLKSAPAMPVPLTHVEEVPESFAMADPVEDNIVEVDTAESHEPDTLGSDTLALNMDEFMNS